MVEVKFTKSPTGRFGLAYSAGQWGSVTQELAKELEAAGYIEPIEPAPGPRPVEEATDKAAEARETRPGRGARRKKRG